MKLKDNIERCISQDKIEDAIGLMSDFLKAHESEFYSDILSLSARFQRVKRRIIKTGEIDEVEINKIVHAVQEILKEIDEKENESLDNFLADKRRLASALSSFPLIMFEIDPDGNFAYSRGKGLKNFGLFDGQVIGANVGDVYKDSHPDFIKHFHTCLSQKRSFRVLAHGYWTYYSPIFDGNIRVVGVNGVAMSVADMEEFVLKAKQEELQWMLRDLERDTLMEQLNQLLREENVAPDLVLKIETALRNAG